MLADVIKSIPNYQSLSSQEILGYMGESVTVSNDKAYTVKDFEDMVVSGHFTLNEVNQILGTLQSTPLFNSAYIAMSTGTGLELASPARQQLVSTMADAAQWGEELKSKVLSLGSKTINRYEQLGLSSLPTVEEVEAALVPVVPDVQSHEVLLTVNRQPDGTTLAMARVTPVGLKDGQVVSRGEPQLVVNGDLIAAVNPILEALIDG
jgi:hypothetical protein